MTEEGAATFDDVPVGRVIDNLPRDLDRILVIGRKEDGELAVWSSDGSTAKAIQDAEEMKYLIFSGYFDTVWE